MGYKTIAKQHGPLAGIIMAVIMMPYKTGCLEVIWYHLFDDTIRTKPQDQDTQAQRVALGNTFLTGQGCDGEEEG
ncbi:hypothetical protein DPEC_G00225710 [Dallia pectoralis]|uniref:Uncharacterized protein n=1 Tax=Dallia pectoralis TaxID=75939 RepID=A0ACC2G0U5_DALPE|nr:hypothetical protein DPEC_G00225710 [Dallia pectoralis]